MIGRERLILALDVETPAQALELARKTAPFVGVFKASPAHVYQDGAAYISELKKLGKEIFLDLKLYDIPETVARLTRQVGRMGVDYLTVHAGGGSKMMTAAQAAAAESGRLKLLAVTVLTSFDQAQLDREWKLQEPIQDRVLGWAHLAREAGLWGIVCSPLELTPVWTRFAGSIKTVVPGIRGAADAKGDQARTMAPAEAVRAGADLIVVGRPIVAQPDPVAAAERIAKELEEVAR